MGLKTVVCAQKAVTVMRGHGHYLEQGRFLTTERRAAEGEGRRPGMGWDTGEILRPRPQEEALGHHRGRRTLVLGFAQAQWEGGSGASR